MRSCRYKGGILRKVLEAFYEKTGVPMVVNTSFNTVKGEPIVETPRDAIESWRKGGIDVLVLGDLVVRREKLGEIGRGDVMVRVGGVSGTTRERCERGESGKTEREEGSAGEAGAKRE